MPQCWGGNVDTIATRISDLPGYRLRPRCGSKPVSPLSLAGEFGVQVSADALRAGTAITKPPSSLVRVGGRSGPFSAPAAGGVAVPQRCELLGELLLDGGILAGHVEGFVGVGAEVIELAFAGDVFDVEVPRRADALIGGDVEVAG